MALTALSDSGPSGVTPPRSTLMAQEAMDAGAAVARFLDRNAETLAALGRRLRAAPPPVVVTCARGSSDHAATYGKYVIEAMLGVPVASAAPSIASVYAAPVAAGDALCIAISQSGRSPDLLAMATAQKRAGAHLVALVNDETSPLAALADTRLPLCAGPEISVAATKSCIAALAGLAAIVAAWSGDGELDAAVRALPTGLPLASSLDWSAALPDLVSARSLFVIGRGYGLGIAQEAALKLKETGMLHAEAFSAAEVRHGPMAIVGPGFPVIGLATSDVAGDAVRAVAAEFAARGAAVHLADPSGGPLVDLAAIPAHPAVEPILMLQSFYLLANAVSLARGLDPDTPPHLAKVTSTL